MSAPIGDEDWNDEPARTSAPAEFARYLGDQVTSAFSGESTSARLRRVEQERDEAKQAFAASQADLTRVEREWNGAIDALIKTRADRDLARAELVTARAELELLRKNEEIRAQVIRELRAELADRKGAE